MYRNADPVAYQPRSKSRLLDICFGHYLGYLQGLPKNNFRYNAKFLLRMRPCTINAKLIASLIFVGALATSFAYAQPITDGFMKGKGNGSLVVSYSWERYDEFYAGSTLREGIDTGLRTWGGEITTQSVSLYGTIGLTDNVDIIVNVPYITVQGAGVDTVSQEDSGLQDASLFVKWRPLLIETGGGNLSFLGALGFATPLSDYEEDLPLSIGNQSTRTDLRLITHFQSNAGLFGELQAGYSLRTNDVPNATLLSAKIGYAASAVYVRSVVGDSNF